MNKIGGFYPVLPLSSYKDIYDCSIFRSGKDAIKWLKNNVLSSCNKILLPSYICDDVVEIFKDWKVKFYYSDLFDVDEDAIKKRDDYILFYVNYFGFPSPFINMDLNHKIVIEDNIGSYFIGIDKSYNNRNNFNIVGLRKMFPVGCGAIIKNGNNWISGNKIKKDNMIYEYFIPSFIKEIKGNESLYLDMWGNIEKSFREGIYVCNDFMRDIINTIDENKEREKRIKNFKYLYNFICEDDINLNFVPLYFLINFSEDLYNHLRNNYIYAAILWKSTNIKYIGIPIGSRYDISDMKRIVSILKEYKGKISIPNYRRHLIGN